MGQLGDTAGGGAGVEWPAVGPVSSGEQVFLPHCGSALVSGVKALIHLLGASPATVLPHFLEETRQKWILSFRMYGTVMPVTLCQ